VSISIYPLLLSVLIEDLVDLLKDGVVLVVELVEDTVDFLVCYRCLSVLMFS
jgi:hypothetical protein